MDTNMNDFESVGVTISSIDDGFEDADVVIIMNSHISHRDLDIKTLSKTSNEPLLFVDCWNLYQKEEIESYHLSLIWEGSGSVHHP